MKYDALSWSMRPVHEHDCDACQFLGHIDGHDLYWHPNTPTTYIARYGAGPDYTSGPGTSDYQPLLKIARELRVIMVSKEFAR